MSPPPHHQPSVKRKDDSSNRTDSRRGMGWKVKGGKRRRSYPKSSPRGGDKGHFKNGIPIESNGWMYCKLGGARGVKKYRIVNLNRGRIYKTRAVGRLVSLC